jgi:hypothetical protein
MMRFDARGFRLPKRGNADDECEDALAFDERRAVFAVADGATESSFSALWSDILTKSFIAAPPGRRRCRGLNAWLAPLLQRWREQIPWERLAWFAEEKAREGAFSTFLGLAFGRTPKGEWRWRAMAIGDCCLFQVRGAELVQAYPVERAAEFGNTPRLLPSLPEKAARALEHVLRRSGPCQANDTFFLATDALAQWCLQSVEAGCPPWPLLQCIADPEEFRRRVDELRASREMRNDDVSLLVVELHDGLAPAIRL